jgi:hypothetical protein
MGGKDAGGDAGGQADHRGDQNDRRVDHESAELRNQLLENQPRSFGGGRQARPKFGNYGG